MANYTFLDASGIAQTAASSVIGGVHYPIVKIPDPLNISGSVLNLQTGTVISSISGTLTIDSVIGTYSEDSASNNADKGIFVLGVRNDTLASVTSADGDYGAMTIGGSGEAIVANAPLSKWVQGVASCFTGVIQPVIAAQGSSVFTYITSGQVANASANNVYLTISSGGTNIAYLPVPANSGALPIMPNGWKGLSNGAISASVSGIASVFLSFQGFISKT